MDAFANPSQLLLDLLPQYGYLALGLATFLGAAGLPVPLTPLLLAAGAITTQGALRFPATVLATWLAAVAGDCAGYLIGYLAGRRLVRRVGPRFGLSTERLSSAERAFRRWGGAAVWLTRWLLTPAGSAVNLLAGAHGYPFRLFLAFDAFGEALWAAGYLALGRFFGDGETDLEGLIGRVTGAAVAGAALLLAGTLVRQRLRRQPAGIA